MPNAYPDRILRSGERHGCGVLIDAHPKCQTCGTLLGHGHTHSSVNYRNLTLCFQCVINWQQAEKDVGYRISYQEYLSGNIALKPLSRTPIWTEI